MSLLRVLLYVIAFFCIIKGTTAKVKVQVEETQKYYKFNKRGEFDISISFDGEVSVKTQPCLGKILCFELEHVDTNDLRFDVGKIEFSYNGKQPTKNSITLRKTTVSNCLTPSLMRLFHRVDREYVLRGSVRSVTTPKDYPKFDFKKKDEPAGEKGLYLKVTNYKLHKTTKMEVQLKADTKTRNAPKVEKILALKKEGKVQYIDTKTTWLQKVGTKIGKEYIRDKQDRMYNL